MKKFLTDLELKASGFIGIKKAHLKFDKPLTIIHGENGSCKSSILDGIKYVHGVPIRNTKASGRERLAHDEDLFDLQWICNKKKLKGTASSIPTVASVEKAVGVSRKALPFCLDPAAFLLAGADALKDLFREVLNLDMDWKKACIKLECSKDLLGMLTNDMKIALKEAKERRAECKGGKGEEPTAPDDPEITVKGGTKRASEINLEALEKAIAQVEAKHLELVEEHAVVLDAGVPEKERKAAQKEIEKLKKEIDSKPDTATLQAKLEESTERKIKEEQKHNELVARQKVHNDLQKKFKEWDVDFCGACKKKLEHFILKEQGSIEGIDKHMAVAIDKIAALVQKENKFREQLVDADTGELGNRIAELEITAAEPISDEEIQKLKDRVEAMDKRLAAGRVTRDAVRDYCGGVVEYELAVAQYQKQSGEWEAWDRICKAIPAVEKDGVTAGLNPLRKIMAKHGVLEGVVSISDDLEFSYDGRPFDLLSKAERYIVSLAPYFATIELFKFPFVIVDDGDFIVTKKLRARLQGVLMAIAKVKPVIFAQAVNAEDTAKAAEKVKGSKVIALYQAGEGTAERIAG